MDKMIKIVSDIKDNNSTLNRIKDTTKT